MLSIWCFVSSGKLSVRLVSRDFEADIEHGEEPSMCKMETYFKGHDFEKQYACRYKVWQHLYISALGDHNKNTGELEFLPGHGKLYYYIHLRIGGISTKPELWPIIYFTHFPHKYSYFQKLQPPPRIIMVPPPQHASETLISALWVLLARLCFGKLALP